MFRKAIVFLGLGLWCAALAAASGQMFPESFSAGLGQAPVADRYARWLDDDVSYLITNTERDVFLKLQSDRERDLFIESFWKHRDPTPSTAENEFKEEHYRRLAEADQKFKVGDTLGRKTDRGRIWTLLGKPREVSKVSGEAPFAETEVWSYEAGESRGLPSKFSVVFTREGKGGDFKLYSQSGKAALPQIKRPEEVLGTVKLGVFEGFKEGEAAPATAVTASSLSYIVRADIPSEADLAAQQEKIKQVFNLKSVNLLTESDLVWEKGKLDKAFHFFRLDDKNYLVLVSPADIARLRFRIEVYEQKNGTKTNLLDTESTVPAGSTAIFGFADAAGKPYFISLHPLKWPSEAEILTITTRPAILAEGPVRAIGPIQPPRLIKQVDPVYPEIARQSRVEGVVILEATTDIYGRVQSVKVLRSIPLLDQAAIDAVRQWVYEPMIIEGRPRGVVFTVTVRFTLDGRPGAGPRATLTYYPGDVPAVLKKIKVVQPAYPEEAIKANAQGTVVLEAVIDETGKVGKVKVLRSVHPALDKAAAEALKQSTFESVVEAGKPKPVTLVFFARFWINPAKVGPEGRVSGVVGGVVGGVIGEVEPPVRAEGAISPPRLIKQVDPIYPEIARQSRIEGIVILEIMTDMYGRVQSAKVLRSIPLLDQAAIDAVRQWIYEPLLVDGKPRACIFTATVNFTIK
jgi:TonB family protein